MNTTLAVVPDVLGSPLTVFGHVPANGAIRDSLDGVNMDGSSRVHQPLWTKSSATKSLLHILTSSVEVGHPFRVLTKLSKAHKPEQVFFQGDMREFMSWRQTQFGKTRHPTWEKSHKEEIWEVRDDCWDKKKFAVADTRITRVDMLTCVALWSANETCWNVFAAESLSDSEWVLSSREKLSPAVLFSEGCAAVVSEHQDDAVLSSELQTCDTPRDTQRNFMTASSKPGKQSTGSFGWCSQVEQAIGKRICKDLSAFSFQRSLWQSLFVATKRKQIRTCSSLPKQPPMENASSGWHHISLSRDWLFLVSICLGSCLHLTCFSRRLSNRIKKTSLSETCHISLKFHFTICPMLFPHHSRSQLGEREEKSSRPQLAITLQAHRSHIVSSCLISSNCSPLFEQPSDNTCVNWNQRSYRNSCNNHLTSSCQVKSVQLLLSSNRLLRLFSRSWQAPKFVYCFDEWNLRTPLTHSLPHETMTTYESILDCLQHQIIICTPEVLLFGDFVQQMLLCELGSVWSSVTVVHCEERELKLVVFLLKMNVNNVLHILPSSLTWIVWNPKLCTVYGRHFECK